MAHTPDSVPPPPAKKKGTAKIKTAFGDLLPHDDEYAMMNVPRGSDVPTAHNALSWTIPASSKFDQTPICAADDLESSLYHLTEELDPRKKVDMLTIFLTMPTTNDQPNNLLNSQQMYSAVRGPMFAWPHGPQYNIKPLHKSCYTVSFAHFRRNWSIASGISWLMTFALADQKSTAKGLRESCQLRWYKGVWSFGPNRIPVAFEELDGDVKKLRFHDVALYNKPLQDLVVAGWCVRAWHELNAK